MNNILRQVAKFQIKSFNLLQSNSNLNSRRDLPSSGYAYRVKNRSEADERKIVDPQSRIRENNFHRAPSNTNPKGKKINPNCNLMMLK